MSEFRLDLIRDAQQHLRLIEKSYAYDVSGAAHDLRQFLNDAESSYNLDESPHGEVERFAQAVQNSAPVYETDTFKCLADYHTCLESPTPKAVCVALAAICIAQQLIPFTGKG
jgi:hypothetical protein